MNAQNQLSFDLSFRPALEREDFLISNCNEDAVNMIDSWPEWKAPAIVIHGPKGSGKTHLSHVWQRLSNAISLPPASLSAYLENASFDGAQAVILDNIDQWDLQSDTDQQEALFHLLNALKNAGGHILITAEHPLSHAQITLPDLRSRLLACPHIEIHSPDDDLLSGLLIKLFRDRQLQITPDILNYCLSRMERSFEAAHNLVHDVDALSLAEKRRITIPLIRRILDGHDARQQDEMNF